MAVDWEKRFSSWAQPPGDTEKARIENAVRGVRAALDADDTLRPRTKVFVQGSYRNRVNVRGDSDVDIGVLYLGNSFYTVCPAGTSDADFGLQPGDGYGHRGFKRDVDAALARHFGRAHVVKGNKAIDVHENSYRIDADVVPVFQHRRYSEDGSYISGVELRSDAGQRIINWPERLYDDPHWPVQHYENAVAKNEATAKRFKGVVRILKTVRNLMDDAGSHEAKAITGFFIECLTFNVQNEYFGYDTWDGDVQAALWFLRKSMADDTTPDEWGEVSELNYLFRGSPGKRAAAYAFVDKAWDYVGVRV